MGMVRNSGATAKEMGPSMGRATGLSAFETAQSNVVGPQKQSGQMNMKDMEAHKPAQNTKQQSSKTLVPGYPQDMTMEMDEAVAKPETYGLPEGWTGSMMGMMTVVRVLPPDMYNKVMEQTKKGREQNPQKPGDHQHVHGG